jgi:hypothetical protein
MFNAEQREWAIDERRTSLTSILIALLNTYAGLATAIAGFVLDNTALVVAGMKLVGSAAVLVNGMAKALNRQEGELCESSHPSRTALTPSVKNSASPSGSPSIRTASTRSLTPPATTSGSTSTSSEPALKVLIAQRSRTGF